MQKWEHRVILVRWEPSHKTWVATFSDGVQIVGFEQVLDHFGSEGWELVSVVGTTWAARAAVGAGVFRTYRAIFKRPKP